MLKAANYGPSHTYPEALTAVAKVEDWSYGNDTAAHLHLELPNGHQLSAFVEHQNPKHREEEHTARYTVFTYDQENEQPDLGADWYETEDPFAFIGYVVTEGER